MTRIQNLHTPRPDKPFDVFELNKTRGYVYLSAVRDGTMQFHYLYRISIKRGKDDICLAGLSQFSLYEIIGVLLRQPSSRERFFNSMGQGRSFISTFLA